MAAPTTLNPEQRSERARKAAKARNTPSRHLQAIIDDAHERGVDPVVAALVHTARQMSDEESAKLRELFAPLVAKVRSEGDPS